MKEGSTQIEAQRTVEEFFKNAVVDAVERQRLETNDMTLHYVVSLLSEFALSKNLYDEDKGSADNALALILAKTVDANATEKVSLFRRVGDIALYVSGFFSDSLNRKPVDIDYYIGIGEGAYFQVSALVRTARGPDPVQALFVELAQKFPRFVDVLQEVSEQGSLTTNTGTLRLYEKWIRTQSERVARQLRDRGVIPSASVRSKYLQ